MSETQTKIKTMIQNGQDPKEFLIEVCRPTCIAKQERLQRCENKLKAMTHADPELSCMYPMRDWVTCIDGCVMLLLNLGSTQNSHQPRRQRIWMAFMMNMMILHLHNSIHNHLFVSIQSIQNLSAIE